MALATMLFLGVFAAAGVARFGSVSAALSYAGGNRILVDARAKLLGQVEAGSVTEIRYQVRNVMPHPVAIQGAQTSCECAAVYDVPCTIGPGGSRSIRLRIKAPNDRDRLWGNCTVFTDDPEVPEIVLGYEGRVVPSAAKSSRVVLD